MTVKCAKKKGLKMVQKGQKAGELLGQVDVTFTVAEVFQTLLVGLAADLLDEELFGPVDGVYNQGLKPMVGSEQVANGGEQFGPGAGPGETGDVEVGGATLGIEEHRCGETGGEGWV